MRFSLPLKSTMRLLAALVICLTAMMPRAADARNLALIRDAEIERTIKNYLAPLLRAAGIGESAITVRLLNDDAINAFATTEMRIFINSGLIMRSTDPGQFKGVLAHEVGHLAGGHLLRMQDQLLQAQVTSLLGLIAGAAAGVVSGRPDLGAAVLMGSSQVATRDFLAFTRTQENAADAFAVKVLDQTGQSAEGMLSFFSVMKDQEALYTGAQDAYARTHPLTQDRIDVISSHVARSANSGKPQSAEDVAAFQRMKAKLFAFMKPPSQTLGMYPPGRDTSVAGRYAQSIAYYRSSDLNRALPLIDGLIAENPNDPYFQELRGQMLFEFQRMAEAQAAYQKAVRLAPTEPLILTALAHVNTEIGGVANLEAARQAAQAALGIEPDNPFAWRQLANAYGKLGDEGMATYAMAEMSLALNDPKEALTHAKRAEARLKKGTPQWVRLQDLIAEAERQRDRMER